MLDTGSARTTYAYSPANRLLWERTGGLVTTHVYDAAGNRTEKRVGGGDVTFYEFDAAGHMTTAGLAEGDVTYAHNADGQRVARTGSDGAEAGYLYDDKNLVHETDGAGDVDKTYAATTDEEYGDLVGEDGDADARYYLHDAQGNVNAAVDGSGEVQSRFKYHAFGSVAAARADAWSTLTADQWAAMTADDWAALSVDPQPPGNFGMSGRKQYYLDPETHLYLLGGGNADGGGRYYDPAIGRFVSEDPIRQAAGDENLYRYVGNDPVDKVDPSGWAPPETYEPNKSYAHGKVNATGDGFDLFQPILDATGKLRKTIPLRNNRPVFDAWSLGEVEIAITGNSADDIATALEKFNRLYPNVYPGEGFTFHHDGLQTREIIVDGKRILVGKMQAVPSAVNDAISHYGSASNARDLYRAQNLTSVEIRSLTAKANVQLAAEEVAAIAPLGKPAVTAAAAHAAAANPTAPAAALDDAVKTAVKSAMPTAESGATSAAKAAREGALEASAKAAATPHPIPRPEVGIAKNLALAVVISFAEAGVAEDAYNSAVGMLRDLLNQMDTNNELTEPEWNEIKQRLDTIKNMKQTKLGYVWEFITYGQGSVTEKQALELQMLAFDLAAKHGYENKRSWSDVKDGAYGRMVKKK